MATIEPYQTSAGKRYRVRYRDPERRQTQKRGFRTKKSAEAFAATVEVAKLRGEYIAPSDGRKTIAELGPGWLGRQAHLKPSAYAPLEVAWRLRVQPRWGHVQLADIRPSTVQQWIADMTNGVGESKPLSATVVLRTHGVLASILDSAVRDRLIPANPARKLKLPRKQRKRPTYLTHEQVDALAHEAAEHGALVLTLAYTGLRWGEVTGMRVRDLDLLRRRATIDENAVAVGRQIIVGTTKGHKRRTVPLADFLIPQLARQCEGKSRDDLVFPGDDGSHMSRPHNVSGWFDRAVAAAGLPKVTPHDLRHTAASLAVSAGANVKALQKMLGHASAAMTLDVYADLFDDDLERVATALSEARSRSNVAKMWPAG